ncbi:MAG: methionine--tRNA ligase [Chloroflexi bacterium]|nr:methionine--tRNA ligase [Chloroflexota bacterium]
MPERILIGVAWPYANGPIHLGHIAGCYLPADIFARYHRTAGNQVLMVSGSDQHGTPVTVRAEQEGVSPAEVAQRYHQEFLETWRRLGISFDLFTRTGTENHARVTHDIFLKLRERGYIYQRSMPLLFCPKDQRFLPDRYVVGVCPHCASDHARGDQCDECGKPLNATELVNPQCVFCATRPEVRDSEHFFLKLSAFNQQLLDWTAPQTHWRPNVYNFTRRYLAEGLHDRAITRDIEWGVSVPVEGWERKRIYVWFEAVIGYLSASIEWAERSGRPDTWKEFWQDPSCKSYNFIGKDNIPFHTIIWPAMLLGYGGLNLPYDVPANEFLSLESQQFSTSRNWAVWAPDYLERYAPDPLRYYLSANMPEAGDTDFSWREYLRRNNDELVATYGNLVHRVLTFTYRSFQGAVPEPGPQDALGSALLARSQEALQAVGGHIALCHFREAIRAAMALAQETNRYLDERAPWKTLREDRLTTATSLHTALTAIACLKQVLYPFLPFSSQTLHTLLGREGTPEAEGWRIIAPVPGQKLAKPQPLFLKLDDKVVEEETARLSRMA